MQRFHHANHYTCLLVLTGFISLSAIGCRYNERVAPLSSEHVEVTQTLDSQTYHLVDNGNVYRELDGGKQWEYYATVFDPVEVHRSYVLENGVTYRVDLETNQRYEVMRELVDSFEDLSPGLPGLAELVAPQRMKWGSFTLQSPQAPKVADYVALRQQLLKGNAQFRDCRIEPTSENAHTGKMSLKFSAPAKSSSMITCKASLSSPLPYFRRGEDFWFEAWYWAEGNLPLTLIDLESEFIREHAGIRVRIFEDGTLGAELKALSKPQYRQTKEDRTAFPKGQWVRVRVHFQLGMPEGQIEIWQNEKLVLSCPGQTLPFRSAIYNSLEIGITAHSESTGECLLYVDDVRMSAARFTD